MIRHTRLLLSIALGILLSSCMATGEASSAQAACVASRPVSWSERLPIDGADLYLLTRGEHCDAPVLLCLHGGPGAAERPLFRLYNRALEKDFVVGYWDQRGAGRSFDPDADPAKLSVVRHLEDLDRVVDHLRIRLGRQKIVLVGHSWGSALGLLYTRVHPQRVAAVVGVAQFVSGLESQRAQYAFVEEKARRRDDRAMIAGLAELGAPPYSGDEALRMQNMVDRFGGVFHNRPSFLGATLSGLMRGYVTPWEIAKIIRANTVALDAMTPELVRLDLRVAVPEVAVPVIFMLGRFDRQLDPALAVDYLDWLGAPAKRLVWFEQSAHNIPFEEPARFNRELVEVLSTVVPSTSGERPHPNHESPGWAGSREPSR